MTTRPSSSPDSDAASAALRAWLIEQSDDDIEMAEAIRRCPDPYNCDPCQALLLLFEDRPGYDPKWVRPDV